MIQNHDRSGWFGASDTSMIMGNWKTATFAKWWLVKLGLRQEHFASLAMQTGTALEHRILDYLHIQKMDRQIKLRRLRLRVNLDGEDREQINEVKTYGGAAFTVSKAHWMQCQAEQYAAKKLCRIVAYRLTPADYQNWFLPIDPERLSVHPIPYDDTWIKTKYLPRLRYLAQCLRERRWPDEAAL